MSVDNATPNRAYQLPNTGNYLDHDCARIVYSLGAIDTDISYALTHIGMAETNITSLLSRATALEALTGAHTTDITSLKTTFTFAVAQIPGLPWSKLTSGVPTTISGYGITDAVTLTGNQTIAGTKTFSAIPVQPTPARTETTGSVNASWVAQFATPAGVIAPFAGTSAPSYWLLCYGQAVSRTTYADLFAAIGTTYGAGDGSTTFNLPDMRGRSISGKDDMGGTGAGRTSVATTGTTTAGSAIITAIPSTAGLVVGMSAIGSTLPAGVTISSIDSGTQVTLSTGTGVTAGTAQIMRFGIVDGVTLGAAGGNHIHALTTPQMPSHTHTIAASNNDRNTVSGGSDKLAMTPGAQTLTTNATGGGQAHPNLPPMLVLNYIIKT